MSVVVRRLNSRIRADANQRPFTFYKCFRLPLHFVLRCQGYRVVTAARTFNVYGPSQKPNHASALSLLLCITQRHEGAVMQWRGGHDSRERQHSDWVRLDAHICCGSHRPRDIDVVNALRELSDSFFVKRTNLKCKLHGIAVRMFFDFLENVLNSRSCGRRGRQRIFMATIEREAPKTATWKARFTRTSSPTSWGTQATSTRLTLRLFRPPINR